MASEEAVQLFQSTTGADVQTAQHCLEAFEGDLDRAVSHYFDSSTSPGFPVAASTNPVGPGHPHPVSLDSDEEEMTMPAALDAAPGASGCEADDAARAAAHRRNQGYLEEEKALEAALAASRVAAGATGIAAPSYGASSSRPQSSIAVSDTDSDQEDDEYEPEVDSDVEMDTEEEYLRKLAAAHLARTRAPRDHDDDGAGPSNAGEASGSGAFSAAGYGAFHEAGGAGAFDAFSGGRDSELPEMPAGVDVEEARMLEAAMLGIPYTGRMDFSGGASNGGFAGGGASGIEDGQPLSPGVRAQRLIRQEQNDAYQESLRADRQRAQLEEAKQAAAVAAARAEAETKAREEEDRRVALEHHAQQLAAKTAALPAEPPVGTADTTAVLVKLPDGTRLSRRFPKSTPLQSLYHFVDVAGPGAEGPTAACQPGSYLLVSPRPRKVHEDTSDRTLGEAGFERQEMLMLEPLAD
mmetsp:Transcript_12266/g.36862  ORF Transcript_12266/g.36862 Transcript_12266/m.36862 type:complete len:466 (+) Transcript_12266:280-1677(+)